jgi:protein TonB
MVRRLPERRDVRPQMAHVEPPAPGPPAAPVEAAASPDVLALFEGEVRQAVQHAATYPMAARVAREAGRAQVSFSLRGGQPGDVVLVQSSGFPMLDQAALAAVRAATYPAPPPTRVGRDMRFIVWVQFRRVDDDD